MNRNVHAIASTIFLALLLHCSGGEDPPNDNVDAGARDAGAAVPDAGTASPDAGPTLPTGAVVFVSSALLSGDSVPSATNRCETLASEAGLPSGWVAWISTPDVDAVDAIVGSGPWHRMDGEVVFADRAALQNGPAVPIDMDEKFETVDAEVYTGTSTAGTHTPLRDCKRWRSYYPEDDGTIGVSSAMDGAWTAARVVPCDRPRRVYCFQSE